MNISNFAVGNYAHVSVKNKSVWDFAQIIKEGKELKGVSISEQKEYQLEDCHPIRLNPKMIESLELETVKYQFQVRYKGQLGILIFNVFREEKFALLPIYNIQKYQENGWVSFNPLIVTDPTIVKDGIDWEKFEAYEKGGFVKSFTYLHELQNYMSDNHNLGEIDFTKIISSNKK